MKVICISGKAGHGKDACASILRGLLEEAGARVLITHYADLVKYVCKTFFDWNGQKDEAGRHLLQYVGTDVVRSRNEDFWVSFIAEILTFFGDQWDYVIIPDTRFPNEIGFLKDVGFDATHLRVVRDGYKSDLTSAAQTHMSETALDDTIADVYIENNGTMDDLWDGLAAWLSDWLDEQAYGQQVTFEELLKDEL